MSSIKMGMKAKSHTLCGGFCKEVNKQDPFGSVQQRRTMMRIIVNYCLKTRIEKASPKAGRKMKSSKH